MNKEILSLYVCECGAPIVESMYEEGIIFSETRQYYSRRVHCEGAHNLRTIHNELFRWVADFERGNKVKFPEGVYIADRESREKKI